MMIIKQVDVIAVEWSGPYTMEDIKRDYYGSSDYGVYQIYGTHNLFGPDSLLYIGKAQEESFAARIPAHKEWIEWESSKVDIYLGRLCGDKKMTEAGWKEWEMQIDRAERLLIYFCSPPYNSKNIQSFDEMPETVIINYKFRQRLPIMVSTLYETLPTPDLKIYE